MVEVAGIEFEEVHCCHWADCRHFDGFSFLSWAGFVVYAVMDGFEPS